MPAKKTAKKILPVSAPRKPDLTEYSAIEVWLLIIIGAFGVMNFISPLPPSVQFISAVLVLIIGMTKLINYESR